jgi:energy-coupling factor transporter ATP-binding protein EcfA2
MSILDEIVSWSSTLPTWQGDAIRRLFSKHELDNTDLDELFVLLRREHGLSVEADIQPIVLTQDDIPQFQNNSELTTLSAIKNLENVNALASHKELSFGSDGLTVIYGDNGSGKSGYTRVLKKACRARDDEIILPNLNEQSTGETVANAVFTISRDGEISECAWQSNLPAPVELSSVAIFDSKCARLYLDNEDDYSFVPYGMDVFSKLAEVCNTLKQKVNGELERTKVDMSIFSALQQTTTLAASFINNLSADTEPGVVTNFTTFTDENEKRLVELGKYLRESNPSQRLQELSQAILRVGHYKDKVLAVEEKFGKTELSNLYTLSEAYWTAKTAADIARNSFSSGEDLLEGTGGEAWNKLFEAARAFAVESHKHCEFPSFHENDKCPLCQQEMDQGDIARMKRFDQFIQSHTETELIISRTSLNEPYKRIVANQVIFELDENSLSELELFSPGIRADLQSLQSEFEQLRILIESATKSRDWSGVAPLSSTLAGKFLDVENAINNEISALNGILKDDQRAVFETEFAELSALKTVCDSRSVVLDQYDALKKEKRLQAALRQLYTSSISRKATLISQQYISDELQNTLNSEFQKLRLSRINVKLQSRTSGGRTLHKLVLDLPQSGAMGNTLSEGEQRAISIASFLAECCVQEHNGAIVFDDPVSSLDHKNRERIAERLVDESANRQVIVFSHDLFFINLLLARAERSGISMHTQRLSRTSDGFGVPSDELPFQGLNTRRRISKLRNSHQQIDALHRRNEEDHCYTKTREAYRDLRDTWERAVEEVLFQKVVQRFEKGVSTQRLRGVVVEDSDYETIDKGMTKASNFSHDNAQTIGISVPEPDELLEDINELDNWRRDVCGRLGVVRNRR